MHCAALLLLLLMPDLRTKIGHVTKGDLESKGFFVGFETKAHDATLEAIKQSRRPEDVVRTVAAKLAISEAAARPLVEAVLQPKDANVAADVWFRRALQEAPKSGEIVAAYVEFLARSRNTNAEFAAAALPFARRLSPEQVAKISIYFPDEKHAIVIADALRSAPANQQLIEAMTKLGSPTLNLAVIDPGASPGAAAECIKACLALGRAGEALQLAEKYPAAVDATRGGLIAAAVVTGNRERAKQLVAKVAAKDRSYFDALITPPDDPFEILASQTGAAGGVWGAALIGLAERGGYHAFAEQVRAHGVFEDRIACAAMGYLGRTADCADATSALLPRPRIVAFTEHAMPAVTSNSARPVTMRLPDALQAVRLERNGEEVAGVAISYELDPVGELDSGGYWIVHSSNGGRTWDAPLYTRLRQNMPYVVVPSSKLPLVSRAGMQIEVQVRELDVDSITFPPVGLQMRREADGLFIDFAWSALRRDSDGDGLTDLVEERLGTDAHDRDTDGDGLPDATDRLPQVARTAATTAEGEVLAQLFGGGATHFLIGRRVSFPSKGRVFFFTPAEHAQYEKTFGPSYFEAVEYLLVRRDGKKAFVYIDQAWAGRTYELTKTKGGWTVKDLGGWIT